MHGRSPMKVAAGVAAMTLVAVGCSSTPPAGPGTNTNAVISISIAEPQQLIPANTSETSGGEVDNALWTGLVDFDANNKPVMAAAESITSTDKKVWTVKIKAGWTFHDGTPVTSDSYINAWNHGAYGPNAMNNNYFWQLLGVQGYAALNPADPDGDGPQKAPTPTTNKMTGLAKVDDTTFTVTLDAPFSDFPAVVGYTAFYPLPDAAWESDGVLKKEFEDAPIGNGPFKMKTGTKWNHDANIEVERYDAYKGTKPKIGGVNFKIYQTQEAAYADLLGGQLDVIDSIPTASLASAKSDLGDRYIQKASSTFQFLAFPTFLPEFSKPEVRKAISMAIDRQEIIDSVFKGSQRVADAFVSPVVAGYRKDACGEGCTFNAAAAKAAYDAAGGPKTLKLTYNADGGHKDWIDATCNQLKTNLGLTACNGSPEPKFADMLTKTRAKQNVGMFRLGWVMDYPSMGNYLGPLYSTNGSSNYYGYSNPQFDQLVKEGDTAATPEEAIAKYQAAEDILIKDMPVIPLRFGADNAGISTRIKNFDLDAFSRTVLSKVEVTA
jgi:oligopeptide transport system substrate-binding protein